MHTAMRTAPERGTVHPQKPRERTSTRMHKALNHELIRHVKFPRTHARTLKTPKNERNPPAHTHAHSKHQGMSVMSEPAARP
eukprot:14808855-Alexandrium_andersonii.AAC.1